MSEVGPYGGDEADDSGVRHGKASKVADELLARELTAAEREALYPALPELQLRSDVSLDVEDTATADAVRRLGEGASTVHLRVPAREGQVGVDAVAISVERYLTLVNRSIMYDGHFTDLPDGRLVPSELEESDVEPAKPDASWGKLVRGYDMLPDTTDTDEQ